MTVGVNVAAIHEALAAALRVRVAREVSVYPFDPGEPRSYPCIVIRPREPWVEFHQTFGDNALNGIEVDVVVMVSARRLDAFLALADFASNNSSSPSSIRYALEADVTLGGAVGNVVVFRCREPAPVAADESGQVGVWELPFEVAVMEGRI